MPTIEDIRRWKARKHAEGEELDDFLLAVVYLTVREINILRDLHGLAPRTTDQVITAIRSQMDDFTTEV